MSARPGIFVAGLVALLAVAAARAEARPTYFEVLTSRYSIATEDRNYACGNCHFLWTGTGARNLFGAQVEQQLYIGKSISQALADVEPMDADGDGFSNLDELSTFDTLPGYSCSNFFLAQGAPIGYDTFITPMVASCLEPLDIRLSVTAVSFITKAGATDTFGLQVINNGSTTPLSVSYELLPGSNAALSVAGPPDPVDIPVGQFVTLDVSFAPASGTIALGTLRITSNDPDEATIDVPIQGFGFIQVLAPASERARCLKSVDKQFRRYAERHLREWGRCYLDEVSGLACDAGRRDQKLQQAEARLRDAVGGAKDKACAGAGISASLLGLPTSCGGGCDGIVVNSLGAYVDCLVCRQNEARDAALRAALGTAPPDLPPNTAGSAAASRCERRLVDGLAKGIGNVQKVLGRCETANVTAANPVDCASSAASELAAIQGKVDAGQSRCDDPSGLLGCLFEGGSSTCLGDAARSIGGNLTGVTFGLGQ